MNATEVPILRYNLTLSRHAVRQNTNRTGANKRIQYFLVFSSEVTIHDSVNNGVNGTAKVPQASGKEKNLKREKL